MKPLVASLADCRELYRLSGWDGTVFSWYCDESRDDDPALNLSEPERVVGGVGYFDHQYPAYDVGYLAAMLPAHTLAKQGNASWNARWFGQTSAAIYRTAITSDSRTSAANALARLAIRLFEAGVLHNRSDANKRALDGV